MDRPAKNTRPDESSTDRSSDMPKKKQSLPVMPIKVEPMDVDRLLLDPLNPRLASTTSEQLDQNELLKLLWEEMAVDELALSISVNGFFQEEPLFIVPKDSKDSSPNSKFYVVEGNRRLAAVLLLRNKNNIRELVGATDLPLISEEIRQQLSQLPVSCYTTRNELWSYLAFRHINSPLEWDAYSKAKFVAHVHDDIGESLDVIAQRTGDRHSTVLRLYKGYKVLQQAEKLGLFDVEDRYRSRFYFSHLYTALDYDEILRFLGITDTNRLVKDDPVKKQYHGKFEKFMLYLYGSKTKQKTPVVQKQNPHLNMLRQIINDSTAQILLDRGYPIEQAFKLSGGDTLRLLEALSAVKIELQEALGTLATGYKGDKRVVTLFEDIEKIVTVMRTQIDSYITPPKSRR
jgi:hypothetical protein